MVLEARVIRDPFSKESEALRSSGVPRVPSVEFLKKAVNLALGMGDPTRAIRLVTDFLAAHYGVSDDEVALLVLDRKGMELRFVAPLHLAQIKASFPFHTATSLASRCLTRGVTIIENRLPEVPHLGYFEYVRGSGKPSRLLKMLSYPVRIGDSPLGVVQISKKSSRGPNLAKDFTLKDLAILNPLQGVLATLLQSVRQK